MVSLHIAGRVYLISSGAHGAGGDTVVFDSAILAEDRMDKEALKCGSEALFGPGWNPDDYVEGGAFHGLRGAGDPVRTVQLAIETDWEFTGSLFGGDTDASSAYAATLIGRDHDWREPAPLLRAGLYWPGLSVPDLDALRAHWTAGAPVAAKALRSPCSAPKGIIGSRSRDVNGPFRRLG